MEFVKAAVGPQLGPGTFISLGAGPLGDLAVDLPRPRASLSLQRQGRCDTYATEFDLEAEEYVPLPKGDVHKKKEIIQDVTLHDLDVANARPQVGQQQACWHRNILYAGGSRPTVSLAASS